MSRFFRPWLCAIGLLIVIGCGKPNAPKDAAEEKAALNLKLFGLGYKNYLDNNQRPPRSLDDLKTMISSDEPIDFARYHIIWNVDLTSITQPRTVLAYDVAVPEKGGMVLFHDGTVERVSAEEFGKLPKASAAKSPAERATDVTFTPTEYFAEFNKLELGMADKYEGKVIELKGIVKGLGRLSGSPELLVVSPGKEQDYVRCFMPEGEEFWAKISRGQEVTVKGSVRRPQGYPMLVNCAIANTGPGTGITITAEELAKDFATNDKAYEKYDGKSLILTGEVVSEESWGTFRGVKLKGAGNKPVECVFYSSQSTKERDKTFVPGAKIKVYAEYAGNGTRLLNCELITK